MWGIFLGSRLQGKCGVVEVLFGPNELGRLIRYQQQRGDGGRLLPPQTATASAASVVVGSTAAALVADAGGDIANNQR